MEQKRILHLGLGAFHRAHQAVYQQALLDAGEQAWALWSGNLRADPTGAEAALIAQDGAYTLETISAAGVHRYQRVNAIARVIPHEPGLRALVEAAADPATRIISCTVTEGGYGLGTPDLTAETIYAFLSRALRQRMSQAAGPVTLLCCDNLRHNGQVLRNGLLQFVSLLGDAPLHDWIEQRCSFPCTMVDRITPRPNEAVRDRVLLALGHFDKAALMAEDWLQWVIEDRFAAGRPPWESVGVQMVVSAGEVTAFEEAKIRILNASHSAMAWAGALRGHRFIHECARDPAIRKIAHDYVTDDVIPLLSGPINLPAYRDAVLARFGNEALGDTVERVLADSAAKVREFILPTLRERLQRGESIASTAMLPALYLRWSGSEIESLEELASDQRICLAVNQASAHLLC